MEKVEKLLLLVVLGAAMVIMAVMSFGSEDPVDPGKMDPNGDSNRAIHQAKVGGEAGQEQQTVDDLNLNKTIDGPKLVNGGDQKRDPGTALDPLAKNKKPGGVANESKEADFPGGPKEGTPGDPDAGPRVDPNVSPSLGLETANVHLAPGDEPGIWIYTVQPKDSLSGIMERITGSTRNVAEIIAGWNEGMDQNRIRIGQKIQIPESMILGSAKPKAAPRSALSQGAASQGATSQGTMAPRRRMPVPGMVEAPVVGPVNASSARTHNRATPAGTRRPVAPRTESYSIKKGETLWAIAKRRVGERGANAYVRRIQDLNPGLEPSGLRPKDVIQLPTR